MYLLFLFVFRRQKSRWHPQIELRLLKTKKINGMGVIFWWLHFHLVKCRMKMCPQRWRVICSREPSVHYRREDLFSRSLEKLIYPTSAMFRTNFIWFEFQGQFWDVGMGTLVKSRDTSQCSDVFTFVTFVKLLVKDGVLIIIWLIKEMLLRLYYTLFCCKL